MSKKTAPTTGTPAPNDPRSIILRMLQHKSGMKQDVYHRTITLFSDLKEVLQEVTEDLEHEMVQRDKRVSVQ